MASLTQEQVWQAIDGNVFAVLGMVTRRGEARTVGIVYVVHERRLYIATESDSWKARHIALNPSVSMTVAIPKHVPFMPWIQIPAATITFAGRARLIPTSDLPQALLQPLFRGLVDSAALLAGSIVIEVTPLDDFLTYGVGVTLLQMRDSQLARGRVATGNKVRNQQPLGR